MESNGNTRHKSSVEKSKSRKQAEKGTTDVLTASYRKEAAVAALPEGNPALPEGARQHSELKLDTDFSLLVAQSCYTSSEGSSSSVIR